MASPNGNEGDALTQALEQAPHGFDFFQAVRRIECRHKDLPRIGDSERAADDPVRFGQEPSLKFAPSTIARFQRQEAGRRPRMWVYFFGLLGPNGPMPLHLTEYAERRQSFFKDRTLARFLDVFHHRMISFFYRAWACSQLTVSRDRPQADRFGAYVASTFGLGMDSLRNRDSVPDTAKLHYSGRLACPTRNAEGLEAILSDYFGVKAEIEQFVGQWIDLPKDCCCRVGESRSTGLLGSTVIVGARTCDCQHWVRNYVGDELSWDVQLVLKADEVPTAQLGKTGRMGWTTWMKSRPTEKDVDDLVLIPS
jgi:type VI secretion system protein ImpH